MAGLKIVGEVGVKVRPDTTDFKHDLKSDLNRIEREIGNLKVDVVPQISKSAEDKVKAEMKALTERLSGKNIDLDPALNQGNVSTIEAALDALTRDRTVNIDVDQHGFDALLMLSGARPQIEAWRDMAKTLSNLDEVAVSAGLLATKLGAISVAGIAATGEIASLGGALASIAPAALALPGIFGGMALGTIAWGVAMKDFNKHLPEFAVGLGRSVDAGTAWKKLQDSMSNRFWKGAEEDIQNLVGNLFPQFRAGMKAVSTDLGVFTGNLAGSLNGKLDGTLKGMFDDLGQSIQITAQHTDAFANIFATLGRVGAGFLPQLATWFSKLSEQFSAFLSNTGDTRLRQYVTDGIAQLKALGSVIASVSGIFKTLFEASANANFGGLVGMADALNKVQANVEASKQSITDVFAAAREAVSNFFDAAGPGLESFAKQLRNVFVAIAPDLGATLGNVVGALGSALSDPQITSGLLSLFNGIDAAAANLIPTFQPVAQMLGSLGPVISALLVNISAFGAAGVDKLAPTFQKIATAIVPVINNLGGLLLKIGDDLAPVFQVIGEKVAELVTHFTPLIKAVQNLWNILAPVLVPVLKIVAHIIGDSLIGVIDGLTMVFDGVTKVIQGVVSFFKGLWDVISGLFTLDFSKVGDGLGKMFDGAKDIIFGTLEAIAGAIWTWMNAQILAPFKTLGLKLLGPLGKLFDPIMGAITKVKDFLSPFWNWIVKGSEDGVKATGSVFSRIADVIKYPFEKALDAVKAVWSGLTKVFGPVFEVIGTIIKTYIDIWVTIFKTAFEVIKTVISTAWTVVSTIFKVAFDVIKTVISTAWTAIADFFTGAMDGLYMVFKGPWDAISEFLLTVWTTIKASAMLLWQGIRDFFMAELAGWQVIFESVWTAIKTTIEVIWGAIKVVFETVWGAIKSVVEAAWNFISTGLSTAWNAVKTATSTVWNAIKSVISTVWNGIKSAVQAAWNFVKDGISDAWNAIKSSTEGVWNAIKSKISDAWSNIKSVVSSAASNVKSAMSDAWTAIKSAVSSAWDSIKTTVTNKIGDVVELVRDLPSKAKAALAGIGTVLVNAGKDLIQGLINGIDSMIQSVKDKLTALTDLIPKVKGPPEKDKVLLTPAGQSIIQSLIDGFESEFANVKSSLTSLTDDIQSHFDNNANYRVGIATELDTTNSNMSAIGGLTRSVALAAADGTTTTDSAPVHIDSITIPLEDLKQLSTLEDFLNMLRVRTRQGVLTG